MTNKLDEGDDEGDDDDVGKRLINQLIIITYIIFTFVIVNSKYLSTICLLELFR